MKTINDYFLEFKNSFKGSHTNYIINNLMESYGLAPLSEIESEIVKEKFPLKMTIPLEKNPGEYLQIIILLESQEILNNALAKSRFFLIYLDEINLKSPIGLSKYVTNLSVIQNSEISFKINWKENENKEEISKDVRIAKENLLNKWVQLKTPTFSMLLSLEEKIAPSQSIVSRTPPSFSNKNNSESKEESLSHGNKASTACKTSENTLENKVIQSLQDEIYNLKKENEKFKNKVEEISNTNNIDKINSNEILKKAKEEIRKLRNEYDEKREEELRNEYNEKREEELKKLRIKKNEEIKSLLKEMDEEREKEIVDLRITYEKKLKEKDLEKEVEIENLKKMLNRQAIQHKNELNKTLKDEGKSILKKYYDLERDAEVFIPKNINLEREIKEKDEEIELLKDQVKSLKVKKAEEIELLKDQVKSLKVKKENPSNYKLIETCKQTNKNQLTSTSKKIFLPKINFN